MSKFDNEKPKSGDWKVPVTNPYADAPYEAPPKTKKQPEVMSPSELLKYEVKGTGKDIKELRVKSLKELTLGSSDKDILDYATYLINQDPTEKVDPRVMFQRVMKALESVAFHDIAPEIAEKSLLAGLHVATADRVLTQKENQGVERERQQDLRKLTSDMEAAKVVNISRNRNSSSGEAGDQSRAA